MTACPCRCCCRCCRQWIAIWKGSSGPCGQLEKRVGREHLRYHVIRSKAGAERASVRSVAARGGIKECSAEPARSARGTRGRYAVIPDRTLRGTLFGTTPPRGRSPTLTFMIRSRMGKNTLARRGLVKNLGPPVSSQLTSKSRRRLDHVSMSACRLESPWSCTPLTLAHPASSQLASKSRRSLDHVTMSACHLGSPWGGSTRGWPGA